MPANSLIHWTSPRTNHTVIKGYMLVVPSVLLPGRHTALPISLFHISSSRLLLQTDVTLPSLSLEVQPRELAAKGKGLTLTLPDGVLSKIWGTTSSSTPIDYTYTRALFPIEIKRKIALANSIPFRIRSDAMTTGHWMDEEPASRSLSSLAPRSLAARRDHQPVKQQDVCFALSDSRSRDPDMLRRYRS